VGFAIRNAGKGSYSNAEIFAHLLDQKAMLPKIILKIETASARDLLPDTLRFSAAFWMVG